ncbi:MAG: siphovirus Gp157 family protein [Methanobrevibacter sp.]|nr:siphovirus Gp157 family protein [Methanobrevibacter sp.]
MLDLQDIVDSGEVIDTQLLDDTLADTTADFDDKIINYAKVIKNLSAAEDAIKAEIERLTARKKNIDKNITNMKTAMLNAMQAVKREKIKGDLFTVSVRANGGKLPVIVDVDTAELPDDLVKIEEKPDLDALAKFIEKNPETQLAHFGERGVSLSIK